MSIPNLENIRILVVEDDDLSFLYLNQILALTRATVIRSVNGVGALEQFMSGVSFDLILMDIQLPDIDGKEVTRRIRSVDKLIPVIAQTAGKPETEADPALAAGCTAVITKPFTMDTLYDVIEKSLKELS
jgi:CheY-like chemotaxis protein